MVDGRGEVDLWWLERVVCGEMYGEEEDTASVGTALGAHDRSLPVELPYVSISALYSP